MSTDQTYIEENSFNYKLERNRLSDLIKRSDELVDALEHRMQELKSDDEPIEPIYDLEE